MTSVGIFTTITEPEKRGDNWADAYSCYESFADELVVIDGKDTWPEEFSWELIGEHFQKGYKQCHADWVIHMDVDFIFHERDFGRIRQALRDYPNSPAVSFYKWQMCQPDHYNLKSRLVLAVNKSAFGNRIKFNGGGDLCQPTLDGKDMKLDEIPQAGVPFYNYEKLTKTKAQIMDDVGRMDRAYKRYFGKWLYSNDGTDQSAYKGWLKMMIGRNNKPSQYIKLEDHPSFVQDTIANLKPDQCGYSIFGNAPVCKYFINDDKIEL